jgi:hypothetical protein
MGRRACTFRQSDLARALKAAKAAGVVVERVEIDREGKLVMVMGHSSETTTEGNEWDAVKQNGTDQISIRKRVR